MNHPYYNNIEEKFGKKKIPAKQQDAMQRHMAYLKEQILEWEEQIRLYFGHQDSYDRTKADAMCQGQVVDTSRESLYRRCGRMALFRYRGKVSVYLSPKMP